MEMMLTLADVRDVCDQDVCVHAHSYPSMEAKSYRLEFEILKKYSAADLRETTSERTRLKSCQHL